MSHQAELVLHHGPTRGQQKLLLLTPQSADGCEVDGPWEKEEEEGKESTSLSLL